MSLINSDTTDYQVFRACKASVQMLENKLYRDAEFNITREDDEAICKAIRLLLSVGNL